MKNEEKAVEILDRFKEEYPEATGTELGYENPLQLLVATILSAQSTDVTVNKITPELFKKYETAEDFAEADREEIEDLIYSSGYFRNKAKWIQKCCKKLVNDYDSEVPRDIEELTKLPGVGRKTANVVLSDAFGMNQGIAVDTHVMRLTKRLELSSKKSRESIERDLMDLLPTDRWHDYTNLLIAHGRQVCDAKKPKCGKCVVSDLCPSAFSFD